MGAASSQEVETWVENVGRDKCAAALAAVDPEVASALRESMPQLSANDDDVDDAADDAAAADSPAPKRARAPLVAFTKSILLHQDNASKVLGYAGYRTVFALEALCARARPALKGAKLVLDASTASSLTVAVRTQRRHELLDARRTGSLPTDTPLRILVNSADSGAQRRMGDVLFRDDRVLFPSPRPRQLFRAASTNLGERDAERSRASLEAHERPRAANLALGCIVVDAHHQTGDDAGAAIQRDFYRTVVQPADQSELAHVEAADEATTATLVEAMGGALTIPRRLVLAAGQLHQQPWSSQHGSRLHLERAFRYSADTSAVLNSVEAARSLFAAVFQNMLEGHRGNRKLLGAAVFRELLAEAGLNPVDSAALWEEAISGALPPFTPAYLGDGVIREVGDVRPGNVATVDIIKWLWPALTAFSLTYAAQGDPVTVFSSESRVFSQKLAEADQTFEDIVIRQGRLQYMSNGFPWSASLAVLDDLAFQREGEDDAPGQARVAAALASLLTPERIPTLTVGTEVEYGQGTPDVMEGAQRTTPITWARTSVVEVNSAMAMATIRLAGEGNETKTVGLGALREGPGRQPCAAAVVLAHAINDHRNDVVLQILSSPLMASPLSLVVGTPGAAEGTRGEARATVLAHAIKSGNVVAVGLLTKNYVCTWKRWEAVLSTCDCLGDVGDDKRLTISQRADLSCAMRKAPNGFINSVNAFRDFEEHIDWKSDPANEDEREFRKWLRAASSGDLGEVRAALAEFDCSATTDATAEAKYAPAHCMLWWAAKGGRADVVDEILKHVTQPDAIFDFYPVVRIAIADGRINCLESLLVAGPSLTKFLAMFAPDATVSTRPLQVILEAIQVDDGASLDLMRSRGVRLGPFDGVSLAIQPVDMAARRGSASAVRAILRDPSVVHWILARKSDAIMRACQSGHAEALAALLERVQLQHTKEDSVVFGNATPLLHAVSSGDLATVEIVLAQGVDVNEQPEGKRSPLAAASKMHSIAIATELLKRGASVGSAPDLRQTAMTYALQGSEDMTDMSLRVAMVQLLLKHSNMAEHFLYFLKKFWLTNGQVEAFLDAGANLSASDAKGVTPLHLNVFYAKVLTQASSTENRVWKL